MTEFAVLSVIRKICVSTALAEGMGKRRTGCIIPLNLTVFSFPIFSKVKGSDTSGHFSFYSSGKWDSVTGVTGQV